MREAIVRRLCSKEAFDKRRSNNECFAMPAENSVRARDKNVDNIPAS